MFDKLWRVIISLLITVLPLNNDSVSGGHSDISEAVIEVEYEESTFSAKPTSQPFNVGVKTTQTPTSIVKETGSFSSTPTPSPTIDPQIRSSCESASFPVEEFNGISCFASDPLWRGFHIAQGRKDWEEVQRWVSHLKPGVQEKLINTCTELPNKAVFENCNQSVRDRLEELKQKILNSNTFESRLNDCLSQIDPGDGMGKEFTKELFWRYVLNEHMSSLYQYCVSNQESVEGYSF